MEAGELELIRKGAEANLYLGKWLGRQVVVKKRLPKGYRISDLDSRLRTYRTIHEALILHHAKMSGVSTPILYDVNAAEASVTMSFIAGRRLKEAMSSSAPVSKQTFEVVGGYVGKLHRNNIIHGDLTTSNVILTENSGVFLIDFGLSFYSPEVEDRGVDVHLMKRTLMGFHHTKAGECFESFLKGYESVVGKASAAKVLKKVKEIERRGRYFTGRQSTSD